MYGGSRFIDPYAATSPPLSTPSQPYTPASFVSPPLGVSPGIGGVGVVGGRLQQQQQQAFNEFNANANVVQGYGPGAHTTRHLIGKTQVVYP